MALFKVVVGNFVSKVCAAGVDGRREKISRRGKGREVRRGGREDGEGMGWGEERMNVYN